MPRPTVAYCPSCNKALCGGGTYGNAVARAQVHCTVAGHPVQIVDLLSWKSIETVAGEPALPLWD